MLKSLITAIALTGLVLASSLTPARAAAPETAADKKPVKLTLLGYSVASSAYKQLIDTFEKDWKEKHGQEVKIVPSYAGSAKQTDDILKGKDADILVTNLQSLVTPLVEKGYVHADWEKRLPNGASPVTSSIALIVRPGNPKKIKTWSDIAAPGINIVALNPKTSGNARWGVLAGYLTELNTKDQKAADQYIHNIVANTKTLSTGGREATDSFIKNGVGDVLITFENEAIFIDKVTGGEKLEYVVPASNVRTDFPVTVIDKNVDKNGTRKVAEAFVQFLYTPKAQQIFADFGYRASDKAIAEKQAAKLAKVEKAYTIDQAGGWPAIDKALFAEDALYDKALAATKKK
jgi:sulfate/thiosulfate transport system substrate-binding protein